MGWVFQFSPWLSSDCLLPCLSLGVLTRGWSWLPLPGLTSPVWSLLAPRSWEPSSLPSPFSRSVTFWRLCGASWSPPCFLAHCCAPWLMAFRSGHCRIPAGLASMDASLLVSSVSARSWCDRASWLAQGCVPLLRPFALLLAF